MDQASKYQENIGRRRKLSIEGFSSLADVGMDGDYVSPLQIVAAAISGPAIVAYNWFDASSVLAARDTLRALGYMPGIPFNEVMERAFALAGLQRSQTYMTQAFHLLPQERSQGIPQWAVDQSFDQVTRHELAGRRVVALGGSAAMACRRHGISASETIHPSARVGSYAYKASLIAQALTACL